MLQVEATTTNTDTREAIIRAAVELFARQGYSATGVQQIADAAGANKAMIYYYFDSKENLYRTVIESAIGFFDRAVVAAEEPAPDTESRIRNFLTTYLHVVVESPELARIIYREIVGAGESEGVQTVADTFRENVRRLAVVLASGNAAGELRADLDDTLAAYSLFGMANIFITRYIVTRQPLDAPALVEHILAMFLNGSRPGADK